MLAACLAALVVAADGLVPGVAVAEGEAAGQAGATRIPGFEGRTLDGKRVSTADFGGQRRILFCFNAGVEESAVYARALARLSAERTRHNFVILGVALGLDPEPARAFAARHRLDFPIVDDSDGRIAGGLGLRSPIMVVGSDDEGSVGLAIAGFAGEPPVSAESVEARVREYLRMPAAGATPAGRLGDRPKAPAFAAERLDGSGTFRLADVAGRPAVLVFFLSGCPHCQQALAFFRDELAKLPGKSRPAFVGLATDARSWAVESTLEEKNLDFFAPLNDRDRDVSTAYGSFAAVPDILLLDAEGRIVHRESGWDAGHDPDVMRMRLAALSGREPPMLLSKDGFSGNDACEACHAKEAATWRFTTHATAFDTLLVRGREQDPKCVGCHVVGFGERGGYAVERAAKHLENVGCESCHGRGGGHLESTSKVPVDYRAACARCHDEEHSLGFDFATFLPKVSHAAIAALDDESRARLVADRDRPRDLLPKSAAFVGSDACRSCHEREYATWSKSAHARSIESLRDKDREDDAACVSCHVTGYGREGGFPAGAKVRSNGDLARVGCESCHGAGADHVAKEGRSPAGVVRLGDKCDSCVILQICGACHDEANDPGFRFHVEERIERQRHGAAPARK